MKLEKKPMKDNNSLNHEQRLEIKIAEEKGLLSIAFPAISSGAYCFPISVAAIIAINTVFSFLQNNTSLNVIFACFDASVKNELEMALFDKICETSPKGHTP